MAKIGKHIEYIPKYITKVQNVLLYWQQGHKDNEYNVKARHATN